MKVWEWQKRLRAAPKVWGVFYLNRMDDGGCEELCELYESEEAAKPRMDWAATRPDGKRFRLRAINIHTAELSRERWSNT